MHQQFEQQYLNALNAAQREAVLAVEGAVLMPAVPGSGKTTVLVNRLGYMVKCCGIAPENILTMTYTVAATREMRQRFKQLFGEEYAERMEFRTINGVCSRIIAYYNSRDAFALEGNEGRLNALVRKIYTELYGEYPDDGSVREIRTAITYAKNMQLSKEEIDALDIGVKQFPEIYKRYNDTLRSERLMDYDDQMIYALGILNRHADILDYFKRRYKYICVDEAQDTSKIQHAIISLLSGRDGNIFMVGDEDQSIYGFRAAYPDALMNFEREHDNARVILMEHNYRSTPEICAAANAFIARSENRRPKSMKSVREGGISIHKVTALDRETQYAFLCELAKRCDTDTAVLYKNNDSAVPLIDMLERQGIPYNCRRAEENFFSNRIIADLRDICLFARDRRNEEAFMRVYYKLGCGISRAAAELACKKSRSGEEDILAYLQTMPEMSDFGKNAVFELSSQLSALENDSAADAVRRIMKAMRYEQYIERNKLDGSKTDVLAMLAKYVPDIFALFARLDSLRNIISAHENREDVHFMLSTIHSSKGLEHERVYIIDAFDGIFPSKTEERLKDDEDRKQYEEERRLFYVAMTRAKSELNLFSTDAPSAFCGEVFRRMKQRISDSEDIFASVNRCLVDKRYTHAELGTGRIIAQRDDLLLVSFGGRVRLMTLDEMLRERALEYEREKPAEEAPDIELCTGCRVRHEKYGTGTVTAVDENTVSIQFDREWDEKRFVLDAVLKHGFLKKI